jgi:hypothetical protein
MKYDRKINVVSLSDWSHHNWPECEQAIKDNFQSARDITFFTNGIIGKLTKERYCFPWIAILHVTPYENIIQQLKHNTIWFDNLTRCKGIFTLSEYTSNFIRDHLGVLTETLYCPMPTEYKTFDWKAFSYNENKRLLHIGHWLRNLEFFYNIKTYIYKKTVIKCLNNPTGDIEILDFLSREQYEAILTENIVCVNLLDASANNLVMECIAQCTPLLINRLPAVEEYLGKDYPLFYTSLEEACAMLKKYSVIYEAYLYLKGLDKRKFSIESFIDSIGQSQIYKSL